VESWGESEEGKDRKGRGLPGLIWHPASRRTELKCRELKKKSKKQCEMQERDKKGVAEEEKEHKPSWN